MKYELIKKSPKMIIAFLGYSFLPKSLAHLELGEYGLGVVYEYSELSFDKLEFSKLLGEQNYLFAFSMGVAVANRLSRVPLPPWQRPEKIMYCFLSIVKSSASRSRAPLPHVMLIFLGVQ